jgi:hypothetical protein
MEAGAALEVTASVDEAQTPDRFTGHVERVFVRNLPAYRHVCELWLRGERAAAATTRRETLRHSHDPLVVKAADWWLEHGHERGAATELCNVLHVSWAQAWRIRRKARLVPPRA